MNGNISNIYCECSAVAKLYTYFSYIHTNEFVFHAGKLIVFFRLATNRRNINSAIVFQFQLWQNIIGINCQDKEHRVTLCHSARLIAVDNRNKRWMKNIALSITLVLFPSRMESILIAFAVHTPKNWSIFCCCWKSIGCKSLASSCIHQRHWNGKNKERDEREEKTRQCHIWHVNSIKKVSYLYNIDECMKHGGRPKKIPQTYETCQFVTSLYLLQIHNRAQQTRTDIFNLEWI